MRSARSTIPNLWIPLGAALSLATLFVPFGLGGFKGSSDSIVSLARIDLQNEAQLSDLASLGLSIYTQIYTPQGGRILFLPVDERQRADLTGSEFAFQIIDVHEPGAAYYLLYGLPEALLQARSRVKLYIVLERQAVAQANPEQIKFLAEAGIKTSPLSLHPLVAPKDERYTLYTPDSAANPLVEEMISQVETGRLYTNLGNLSGEWPVNIDGSPYTIATRYTYTDVPIKKATRYAYNSFGAMGIPNGYDYYNLGSYQKRSVLAEQTGILQPERILLLSAHLDSTSHDNGIPSVYAPGADDNASGSAALLHIAEILSQYVFGCTLRYALFTGEEQGLYGSKAYAADVYAQGENLAAVLNLDMLGYNTPGSPATIELHTRPGNGGDLSIANLFAQVISTYNINLTPLILQDGLAFSDHSSFWTYGYPAILAMEDWNDHTPYYHTQYDQLESLDMSYYTEFAKAALATFAHMGCLAEEGIAGSVKDASSQEPIPGASVEARLNNVLVGTASTNQDGDYYITLPPQDYTVSFLSSDHRTETMEDVHITPNQVTQTDASLQPCVTIKDVSFSYSPLLPEVNENISFTSVVGAGDPPMTYAWDLGDGGSASAQAITHVYGSKGGYTVRLRVDNFCDNPQTYQATVIVDPDLIFLPLVARSPYP